MVHSASDGICQILKHKIPVSCLVTRDPANNNIPLLYHYIRKVNSIKAPQNKNIVMFFAHFSFSESTNRTVNAAVLDGVHSTDTTSPTSTNKCSILPFMYQNDN